jgi:hypothetical protein
VFSPLTVGRMLNGSARMKKLQDTTDRAIETVTINGADVKRVLLRTGQKSYRSAIHMYLLDKVVDRVETALLAGTKSLAEALKVSPNAMFSRQWVDIGGQMMPQGRVDELCQAVETGNTADLDTLSAELDRIQAAYVEDEWAWVCWAYKQVFDADMDGTTAEDLAKIADDLATTRGKFLKLILNDAGKEFGEVARTGFGQDGTDEDVAADFAAVRGELETNKFVKQVNGDIASLAERVESFKQAITKL